MFEKNVVIVGLSGAGRTAALQLLKTLPPGYRIVAIEKQPVAFHIVAGLRAAVVPGWEDKVVVPYDNIFPPGGPHVILNGTKVVSIARDRVTVDHANQSKGFGTDIPFEYLLVATGSIYSFPTRLREYHTSIEEVKQDFRSFQSSIARAKDILVIGGGPVGVEFAGEVAAHFGAGTKNITIVQGGDRLIGSPFGEKLSRSLLNSLKSLKVEVLFNDRVEIDQDMESGPIERRSFKSRSGKEIVADFILIGTGGRPDVTLIQRFKPEAISENGRVKVRPTLQLQGSSDNIFAAGDISDTSALKTLFEAERQGPVMAKNIVNLIKGKQLSDYSPSITLIVVPVGPKAGAAQVSSFTVGGWFASMAKGKDLFLPVFHKALNYKVA